jgi:hypothetical protein
MQGLSGELMMVAANKTFWAALCCVLAMGGFLGRACAAQEGNGEDEALYQFLQGKYELIGRFPDSDTIYSGTGILRATKDGIEFSRTINGTTIKGAARLEFTRHDRVKVLRMRFADGDRSYEGTYVLGSDLDNYARLTGYVYLQDGKTQRPGIEAWFADVNRRDTKKNE